MRKSATATLLYVTAIVALCAILTSCDQQGAEIAASGPPKLVVVEGDTVNWGDVGSGVLRKEVKIANAGGDTLRITRVKASCGCTTAPLDKEILLPGDTATINLSMDVNGRKGEQYKSLTIYSNDTIRGDAIVYLKANVLTDIEVEPDYLVIQNVDPGKEGSAEIVLANTGKEAVVVQPPTLEDTPMMVVRFDMSSPATIAPGDSLRVKAMARPMNAGVTNSSVIFKTSSKLTPELKLSLTCNTQLAPAAGG